MSSEDQSRNRVQYLCTECNRPQTIVFTPKMKQRFILDDVEFKARGLALYSAFHPCLQGITGVNNLFIDHNLHVRSYKYLTLPEYKVKKKSVIPLPTTQPPDDKIKKIIISHIKELNEINLTIYIDYLEAQLIIGHPDIENSAPLKLLKSDNNIITLRFYYSDTRYTSQVEKWFILFISIMEYLPPSRLGLIIEVLQFILEGKDHFPSEFDENIIKLIISAHEVFFEINETLGTEILDSYGKEEAMAMKTILLILQEDPLKPLHQFSIDLQEDVVFAIYSILLLERHGFLTVHRPGIISANVDFYDMLN